MTFIAPAKACLCQCGDALPTGPTTVVSLFPKETQRQFRPKRGSPNSLFQECLNGAPSQQCRKNKAVPEEGFEPPDTRLTNAASQRGETSLLLSCRPRPGSGEFGHWHQHASQFEPNN
jgi:hypothetical protein